MPKFAKFTPQRAHAHVCDERGEAYEAHSPV